MDLRRDRLGTRLISAAPTDTSVGTGARLALGAATGLAAVALSWNASDLGERSQWWAASAAVLLAALLGGAWPLARRLLPRPGAVPLTVLAWLAAVYSCAPETDQVLGVAMLVAMVAMVELVASEYMPFGWQLGIIGAVLWAGLFGATGRQSALVGALFGAWPVALGPLAALLSHLRHSPHLVRWAVVAIGTGAALAVARTGALATTIWPALRAVAVWGSVSLVVTVILGWVAVRRQPISATPASRRRRTGPGDRPSP